MPLGFDPLDPDALLEGYELVECYPNDEPIPTPGTCYSDIITQDDGTTVTVTYCTDEVFNPGDYPILDPLLDILNTPPVPPVAITPPANPTFPGLPPASPFDPIFPSNPPIGSSPANSDGVFPSTPYGTITIIESDDTDLGITGYDTPSIIPGSIS